MSIEAKLKHNYFDDQPPPTKPKRRRFLRFIKFFLAMLLFLAGLTVILGLLMLKKPDDYTPPQPPPDEYVSQYLTNYISTEIYNGAQSGEAFDLYINETGINDIISRSGWPKEMGSVSFTCPETIFHKDLIELKGLMKYENIELFITVSATGFLDTDGLMHLSVEQVKIGALNLLPIARLAAIAIYNREAAERELTPDMYEMKVMEALLYDKPFEPVFKVEENYIRITKVSIVEGMAYLHFDPWIDPEADF